MFTKVGLVLSAILATTLAQRPPYAGSNFGRPELAPRFKNTQETTTISFESRIKEDSTTNRIPTDARGDVDLVHRLNQWPRENQPFWLLNAQHIEQQRHPQEPGNNFGIRPQEDQMWNAPNGGAFKYENQGKNNPNKPLNNFGIRPQEDRMWNTPDDGNFQYENQGQNNPREPVNNLGIRPEEGEIWNTSDDGDYQYDNQGNSKPAESFNNYGIRPQEDQIWNTSDDGNIQYKNQGSNQFDPSEVAFRSRSNFGYQDNTPSRPIMPPESRPWYFGRP